MPSNEQFTLYEIRITDRDALESSMKTRNKSLNHRGNTPNLADGSLSTEHWQLHRNRGSSRGGALRDIPASRSAGVQEQASQKLNSYLNPLSGMPEGTWRCRSLRDLCAADEAKATSTAPLDRQTGPGGGTGQLVRICCYGLAREATGELRARLWSDL